MSKSNGGISIVFEMLPSDLIRLNDKEMRPMILIIDMMNQRKITCLSFDISLIALTTQSDNLLSILVKNDSRK